MASANQHPIPSQKDFAALKCQVEVLQRQLKAMRKRFRPSRTRFTKDAQLPLFPSYSARKNFYYFSDFPRRPIRMVKSMLRSYDLDFRGVTFSFVGPAVLEALIDIDKSQAFCEEMRLRGHLQKLGWKPFSGFEVKQKLDKGTFRERLEYAKTACKRRWLQLKDRAKDRASFEAFNRALEGIDVEASQYMSLSPLALPFTIPTSTTSTPDVRTRQPRVRRPRSNIPDSEPHHSAPSTVSQPTSAPAVKRTADTAFGGLRKGFLVSKTGAG